MPQSLTKELENDEPTDYLATLVGDGKKYSTESELAKAYFHADRHLRELTEKLDAERNERNALQTKMDEVLLEIRAETPGEPASAPQPRAKESGPSMPTITDEDVTKLVETKLEQKERDKMFAANSAKALEKLSEHYGTRNAALAAINKVTGRREDMVKIVDEMAATSPDDVFDFITSKVPKPAGEPTAPGSGTGEPSSQSRSGPAPHSLKWSDCCKLRREKPQEYNTPEFRKQMEAAAVAYEQAGLDFYAT